MKKTIFTVDCSADPFVPEFGKVRYHEVGDAKTKINFTTMGLYLAGDQFNLKAGEVYGMLKRARLVLLNANVLDFLLENQHFIPESWRGFNVTFWGTIYKDKWGESFARNLCWIPADKKWGWRIVRLRSNFLHNNDVAAII